ncbi:MAG: phosphopantothenate/pantothenate synthetase [Thermoplasmata archaeon]|nr:phosphopantothenate/pantothenate synthetase [Thermoplasmata archaeon]
MTRLSPRHPRYRSLILRERLARGFERGLVAPEGLIAQGRAEAFDYLLGERTTPSALRAERLAAKWLRSARRPVLSVNGNVAALASRQIAELARAVPHLRVEVNLFHRTAARVARIARELERAGVRGVLGRHPTRRVPGLPSDRAAVEEEGIWSADLCLIPLEDGDRALALRRLGKRVVAIDLNPLSRTVRNAHLAIVDELTRALPTVAKEARKIPRSQRLGKVPEWASRLPAEALRAMRSSRPGSAGRGASARFVGRPR